MRQRIFCSLSPISPKDSKIHHQLAAIYRHKNLEQARAFLAGSNSSAEDVLKLHIRTEDPLSRRRELQEALWNPLDSRSQTSFNLVDDALNDEPRYDLEHWESLSNALRVEDPPAETLEERLEWTRG